MRVFAKLFTAVRGSVREAAETVVDANALRIFEQEIHECEEAIRRTKENLACVVAEKRRLRREIRDLGSAVAERENQAVKAMQAGEEALAREIAELIAAKERALADQRRREQQLETHEARLYKTLRMAIQQVQHYRHELRMAKATVHSQRAFHTLAANTDMIGGKFDAMQDSLERIKRVQEDFADQLEAVDQVNRHLSEDTLDGRIKATLHTAEFDPVAAVLKRVRGKAQKENSEDSS